MKILIVVDCQNDFITGELGSKEAQKILPGIQHKIDLLESNDLLLFTCDVHTQEGRKTIEETRLPLHCLKGSVGAYISKELSYKDCSCPHDIITKNSFMYMNWLDYFTTHIDINNVTEIEICGVCTDICVISNALALRSILPYTPIRVDANTCAGSTPEMHEMALKIMEANLIDIVNVGLGRNIRV